MKKRVLIALVVVLVLAATASVASAGGRVIKSTGKDAAPMIPAVDMFGLGSAYDNEWQIPGAKGKVNLIQPSGNVDVILGVGMDGLHPGTRYIVFLDEDGSLDANGQPDPGPWIVVEDFWTDEHGHGDWNYTAPAGAFPAGPYKWAVWVNRTDPAATVLVSGNIEFSID